MKGVLKLYIIVNVVLLRLKEQTKIGRVDVN
jgi:hypothetical protein